MASVNLGPLNEFVVALFGPQVTNWTSDSLSSLRFDLLGNPNLEFLSKSLTELPSLWSILEKDYASQDFSGVEKLKELHDFAIGGGTVLNPQDLTNTHLAPLTVVSHIVEFTRSVDNLGTKESLARFNATQGFCIGFLSAAALASANDWDEFKRNVSGAIQLAACIGIAVDAGDASHSAQDRATAVSVHWKTASDRAYLEACLDLFPKAYVSCITDDRTLTITLLKGDQEAFCSRLREAKIGATIVGLNGCYHHSRHTEAAHRLIQLCAANSKLRLPEAGKLRLPLRSTADGSIIRTGALHEIAIELILCKRAHWSHTVKLTLGDHPYDKTTFVPLGGKSCIPRSLSTNRHHLNHDDASSFEEIAVVGMACRFPQADTLEEFWELLRTGRTAFGTIPPERFNPADINREPKLPEYWGNFLRRPDAFDHRFFGISGREAKSMDPQQRLALQVAYEALESSGYCSKAADLRATDIGCYLGVGSVDYEDNIASETANAFAATGMLRAFISGRISHFFGWSGPSITFDTACSSSAVAIHTACKALLGGECSMALAGGVNVITSPTLHQNLAGGGFLNPNGSSKAFDTMAGGYCRGEGSGILLLKPLSRAKADGDTVLGVIATSAVNQGSNCSPITVPDNRSQSSLYERVLSTARIKPSEVTYVEAHGTGKQETANVPYDIRLYKTIPKQANFVSLSPRIKVSPSNRIIVPQTTQPWTTKRHVALVNNYGAAGSNAVLIIRAYSDVPGNLQSYINELVSWLPKVETSLGSIAYNLARGHNSSFDHRVAFTTANKKDFLSALNDSTAASNRNMTRSDKYPVVLCFGGQTGRNVTISKELYEDCDLLRAHLCWIESGLEVDTVIGHSFGQLAALCIAGSISLEDTARIIRDSWDAEQCDKEDIEAVVQRLNATGDFRVDIACYNGPRSFVLAGNTQSIEKAAQECRAFKMTRLQNTHAYHSYVADGILSDLKTVAELISIRPPRVRIETCAANGSWTRFTADEVVEHTRQPVYFADAIERIAGRLPSAVWLEAGSTSPIITMTRRILSKADRSDIFIPMELGGVSATANLADAACRLWKAGSAAQHWLFQPTSSHRYERINLPPYQFEKTSHWIEYKPRSKQVASQTGNTSKAPGLVSLLDKRGPAGERLFLVNTSNAIFQLAGQGHAVTGKSLCPASMYIEMAVRCAMMLPGIAHATKALPHVEGLTMSAPLGLGAGVPVYLRLRNVAPGTWDFAVFSRSSAGGDVEPEHAKGLVSSVPADDTVAKSQLKLLQKLAGGSRISRIRKSPSATGVSGAMVYKLFSNVVEYANYYRGVQNLSAVDNEAVGLVTVPTDRPLGLDAGICDPISLDNFLQVAGIHVNCLSPRKEDEVFMCTAVEEVIFSSSFMMNRLDSRSWTVHTRYETTSKSNIANDIFVCDAVSKELVVAIMGATFRSVPFRSLARSLTRLNNTTTTTTTTAVTSLQNSDSDSDDMGDSESHKGFTPLTDYDDEKQTPKHTHFSGPQSSTAAQQSVAIQHQPTEEAAGSSNILQRVRDMFSAIMEMPIEEIEPSSKLDDLGIDSLLVTEVLAEIQTRFLFQECTDVLDVARFIQPAEKAKNAIPPPEVPSANTESSDKPANGRSDSTSEANGYDADSVANHDCFIQAKALYDRYAEQTGFKNFYTDVFPLQFELVVQYVLAAFTSLGCAVPDLKLGDEVPVFKFDPKHNKDAGLVKKGDDGTIKTIPALILHNEMLKSFPKHASETKLLYTTGHRLADCLSDARALLADVYTNAPMFKTGTLVLAQHLSSVLKRFEGGRELKILELGAGTGGTTKDVYKFSYTFTDLSPSLFAKWPFMRYATLDIEKEPNPQHLGAYDIIISTNCIHATKSLMLSPDGILCLVELTRNLFWFDLVFGLLEGWWLFSDGREHALASEQRWDQSLRAAGNTSSAESDILRVIIASPYAQTVAFKQVDGLDLQADIYFPPEVVDSKRALPVVTLPEGPMTDVADALLWIRTVLPKLALSRSDVRVDADKVVAVGWSSGGHLAMTLSWTSAACQIKPPSAILAFYCPSDYEDSFWITPNVPAGSRTMNGATTYELDDRVWEGISDRPIIGYNPPSTKRALGGWLAPSDSRSRLALYMNWHGRTLHVLLSGLDEKTRKEPETPAPDLIKAVSPLARARARQYATPTFIIHPREDDLVPWQQAERTWQALRANGTDAELRIVEDVPHLFDLYPEHQDNEVLATTVVEGYEFLCRHVGLTLRE
ncbi:ketoacyl-synt-domain-containing protein [Hypoxylon sp. EC38]|nr:ketoacyl-synt-domain-containing protein [Hypoxylon sp. EC38]